MNIWHPRRPPPYLPGEAPFRMRGNGYLGHLEYVRDQLPGGRAAHDAALGDPALARFFDQPFFTGTKYDVFPLVAAGNACSRILGMPLEDFLRMRSRHQLDRDIGGIFKFFLRLASPSMIATRIPKLISDYFDFGSATAEAVNDRCVRGRQTGAPKLWADWYRPVAATYLEYLLEVNGAKDVQVEFGRDVAEPPQHGMDMVTIPFEVRWS